MNTPLTNIQWAVVTNEVLLLSYAPPPIELKIPRNQGLKKITLFSVHNS